MLFKNETLTQKFIKKGFWIYFFTLLGAPMLYITRITISNDLPVSDVGIIYSIVGILSIMSALNGLGLGETLSYYLPKYYINKKYNKFKTLVYISFGIKIITGIILTLIAFVFIDTIAYSYLKSPESIGALKFFLGYFLSINILHIIQGFFQSVQDTFHYNSTVFMRKGLISLLVLLILFLGIGNIVNYSIVWFIGIFITTLYAIIIFIKKYSSDINKGKIEFNKKDIKKYIIYGIWLTLATNSIILIDQIDQQMVLIFLGAESAGYYTNFISLVMIMTFLFTPIIAFLFPVISEIISKKQYNKLELLQDYFYNYLFVFALSLGFILSVLGEVVSVVFYGENYLISGEIFKYIAILVVFKILFMINLSILMRLGKNKKRTIILLIALLINILLNLLMIPTMGLIGAGFATGITWIFISTVSFIFVNNNCKINFNYIFIVKNLIIFIILTNLIYFFKDDIFILKNEFRFINLAYLIIIGLLYYIVILLINIKEAFYIKQKINFNKKNNFT